MSLLSGALLFGVAELDLLMGKLTGMYKTMIKALPRLAIVVVMLLLTWLLASAMSRAFNWGMRRADLDKSLRELFAQIGYGLIWVVGVFASATVLFPSLTPGKFVAALGVGSVAIGFAFKDIFQNFFAGVLILWRFPFSVGDYLRHDGVIGCVEEITIRSTFLRTPDGRLLIVPNAELYKDTIEVLTSRHKRRLSVVCGIGYGEDIDKAVEVIEETMSELGTVEQNRQIDVFVDELAGSSVNIKITWWTGATPFALRKSKHEVLRAIKYALDQAGIEIPFPQRTLTFGETVPVPLGDERGAANGTTRLDTYELHD